jgi:GT2 family glycosyltransferase
VTDLSVLIVNYNSWRLCVDAIRSLERFPPHGPEGQELEYEVIVVDNCSPLRDEAAEAELEAMLPVNRGRLIRHDQNGGYSQGMNLAYAESKGRNVLVCNPDLLFTEGCVSSLVQAMDADEGIGAAAPIGFLDEGRDACLPPNILPTLSDLLSLTLAGLSPRFTRAYTRRRTRSALPVWRASQDVDLEMLSGCCFLMRRSFIQEIGFFDERFPLYFEDTDLSVRIRRAGKRIVQIAAAELIHFYNRSGQTDHRLPMERYWVSRRRYYRKWYGLIGAALYGICRGLLTSSWGEKRGKLPPHPWLVDLGSMPGKPTLDFDRSYANFLVEVALDPGFFLAAGIRGSGDSWSPSDSLMNEFGPTTYYFRVVDLDSPKLEQIGVYSYTRLAEDAVLQAEA